MADRSYLDWPFFAERHRSLAADLTRWADEAGLDQGHGDVDAACRDLVRRLGEAGWLRHAVAGGVSATLDVRSLCLLRECLSYRSGLADFAFAMQGLGSGAISLFGSERQRADYLPAVAAGRKIAAFALSEKEAGSDVAAIAASARPEGGHYLLNGEKSWISNGGIADFYCVFARTGEAPGARGLSAFIVDKECPGFAVSERIDLIAPHPLGTLRFEDCRVPRDRLIGAPGQGFKIAMAVLDVFRSTVGAAALGFARRALDEAVGRSRSRHLFGAPLSDLQLTQARLAEMALDVDASALLVYRSAWTKDNGQERVTREAAMAKLFATESAQSCIDKAVQLFGAQGVVSGHIVERLYREIRALRIYEGASEVQKIVIARQVLAGPA
jgi:acyl-CoA dehydrogenase